MSLGRCARRGITDAIYKALITRFVTHLDFLPPCTPLKCPRNMRTPHVNVLFGGIYTLTSPIVAKIAIAPSLLHTYSLFALYSHPVPIILYLHKNLLKWNETNLPWGGKRWKPTRTHRKWRTSRRTAKWWLRSTHIIQATHYFSLIIFPLAPFFRSKGSITQKGPNPLANNKHNYNICSIIS